MKAINPLIQLTESSKEGNKKEQEEEQIYLGVHIVVYLKDFLRKCPRRLLSTHLHCLVPFVLDKSTLRFLERFFIRNEKAKSKNRLSTYSSDRVAKGFYSSQGCFK